MIIESKKLGTIEVLDEEEIHFVIGLKGFEKLERYILVPLEGNKNLYWLQCLDDTDVVLACMDPTTVCKNYSPSIDEETLKKLEVTNEEDVLIINTVVIPGSIKNATVNLAAPIIINMQNNKAAQVVLRDDKYPVKHNIFVEKD